MLLAHVIMLLAKGDLRKFMDKRFITILAVLVVGFAGLIFLNQNKSSSSNASSSAQSSNHIQGKGAKKVTLVEYGDFECPVCYGYFPIVEQVVKNNSDNIYFQFKHLPLVSIHKNAFAAARAAEAAGMQNKFFEMYDKLYQNQDPGGSSGWVASTSPLGYFDNFAKQIGLDVTRFDTDYASDKVNDTINADLNDFKKTGQQMATPTFFINGVYVPNSKLADSSNQPQVSLFQKVIDEQISKSN